MSASNPTGHLADALSPEPKEQFATMTPVWDATTATRIRECSVQAGPLERSPDGEYRVVYRALTKRLRHPLLSMSGRSVVALINVGVTLGFFMSLASSSRFPSADRGILGNAADLVMIIIVGVIGFLLFIGSFTVSRATLLARHPRPVAPDRTLRVAFFTTIVPAKEPLHMVVGTLRAARSLRWPPELLDVWLLDESSDDPEVAEAVRDACAEIGVHHFSRRGMVGYNQPSGPFAAKTKHGNINAWLAEHGTKYDVVVAVDPDHRPLPNMLMRMLGYLRDQDVAFVVGPQDYGNFPDSFVARMAEYQQHFFHSILQPAGNAQGCAMHVGTNYAFRIRALQQVGGFRDSITEDMATGLAIHQATNPVTGRRWRSVYTPDVLAIGEGPATWTDYFTQQMRWCRGTLETWFGQFLPGARKLPPKVLAHYGLLMSYYPATAMAWILGSVNSMLYLVFGVSSIHLSHNVWLMLYTWLLATQLGIYFLGRRHTVSPFEPEGSLGMLGLVASVLCTPVYVSAFLDTVRRRPSKFMVTPKGDSANRDHFATFHRHLRWAMFFTALLAISVVLGHDNAAMRMWALLPLIVCLTPPLLWVGRGITARMTAHRKNVVPQITHALTSNNMPVQRTEGKEVSTL